MDETTRVLVTGANHSNPNRGVQALVYSVIDCLAQADPSIAPVCQAFGEKSVHQAGRELEGWQPPPSPGNRVTFKRRIKDLADRVNGDASRRFAHADAVLDISGGDAFATIYGDISFETQCMHKERAIQMGVPLVLLPQTFGPYDNDSARARARAIVEGATSVATREAHGAAELVEVLGIERSDVQTVPDVAFSLTPREPADAEWDRLKAWAEDGDGPILGLNVSGLLWFGKDGFDRSKFEAYRTTTLATVRWYLGIGGRVLLIPHVGSSAKTAIPEGSDDDACNACFAELGPGEQERVTVPAMRPYDCQEMKAVIGLCDHFAGSRMHSWIGAASQAIPAISLAYSKKAQGVLDAFTEVPLVYDLAAEGEAGLPEKLRWLVDTSDSIRQTLEADVEKAKGRISAYFRALAADLKSPESVGLVGSVR